MFVVTQLLFWVVIGPILVVMAMTQIDRPSIEEVLAMTVVDRLTLPNVAPLIAMQVLLLAILLVPQLPKLLGRWFLPLILVCGLVHKEFSLSKAMEMAALEEIKRMNKHLPILDTMITAAPLLGILGTVLGIIHSFDMLGSVGIQDPQAVTSGIAQALLTTAAGLFVAIFTLFPYNYFNAKVEKARIRIEKYATSLEIVANGDKAK